MQPVNVSTKSVFVCTLFVLISLAHSSLGKPRGFSPKNLVFQGLGLRAIAFVGALDVLQEKGNLNSAQRVAGASSDSFVSLLLALGCGPDSVRSKMEKLSFNLLLASPSLVSVKSKFDCYSDKKLEALYTSVVNGQLSVIDLDPQEVNRILAVEISMPEVFTLTDQGNETLYKKFVA